MSNPERAQDKQDAAEVKNFTRTPNMLIFGYQNISPQEKWLYVCLKHLCGKRGTRYLALRYISEQTGISVGALSKSKDKKGNVNEGMIRHLHDAGLIHAEIKKAEGKGNAQYHITITDIWDLNSAFFIERKTRSEFGQDEEETVQPVRNSDEPVQISDTPVRNSDKLVQISDEPVRIPVQYQDYSKTTNKITDKTVSKSEKNETAHSDEHLEATASTRTPSPVQEKIIDSDSHQPSETSQSSEQKSGAASDYGKTEETQQTRKRRNRKPIAPKVDMAEVELYLDVFDELYREISKEPETGYGRTGVDREAIIKDLLTPKLTNPKFVTPEKLKAVYRALYKKPKDEKTGFCWADNMSIKAVCRNYAKEAMTLAARAKEREAQSRAASTPSSNSTLDNLRRLQAKFVGTATAAVQGGL